MKHVAQLPLMVQLPDDETFDSFQSESSQLVVQQLKQYLKHVSEPTQ